MGERKVLNKRIPPDFDPSKLPKQKRAKISKVRTMYPITIRCKTCGHFISKGTKYNALQELVENTKYLGRINIYRFYSKCPNCFAELIIRTDPQHADYVVEAGAQRCYEPSHDEEEKSTKKQMIGEFGDAMSSLENRAKISKSKEKDYAALDELQSLKRRQSSITCDAMLRALKPTEVNTKDEIVAKTTSAAKEIPKRSLNPVSNHIFKPVPTVKAAPKSQLKSKSGTGLQLLCQNYDHEDDSN